jgi:TRAP-type uncharacterized transport system substrate-binding protein
MSLSCLATNSFSGLQWGASEEEIKKIEHSQLFEKRLEKVNNFSKQNEETNTVLVYHVYDVTQE